MKTTIWAALATLCLGSPALSDEIQLRAYLGVQDAVSSRVSGDADGPFAFDLDWNGNSFDSPLYYGFRATWWTWPRTGIGLEFNHQKIYGDPGQIEARGFERLEFTDGLNLVTLNLEHRLPDLPGNRVTPYVGAGLGIAVPHVDVERGGSKTFEYQFAGPAATAYAGVDYAVTPRLSLFAEAKIGHARLEADLGGGGSIETDVVTRAINFGVGYSF